MPKSCCSSNLSLGFAALMDALLTGGVFVAGLGLGVALVGSWNVPSPTRPCACECHCAAPIVPRDQGLSLSHLIWVLSFFIAIILVLVSVGGFLLISRVDLPAKGKGKKGTFGAGVPLLLKDGQSLSR